MQDSNATEWRRRPWFGTCLWVFWLPAVLLAAIVPLQSQIDRGTIEGSFDPAKDTYFNSAAFTSPNLLTFGNTARYLSWARGFWQKSESLELRKTLAGIPTFGTVTNIQGTPRRIQLNAMVRF